MLRLLSEQQQLLGSFCWQGSSALSLGDSPVSRAAPPQSTSGAAPREKAAARGHQARRTSPIPWSFPLETTAGWHRARPTPASCVPPAAAWHQSLQLCFGPGVGSALCPGRCCSFRAEPPTLPPSAAGNSTPHPPATTGKGILLLGCSVALRWQGKPPWHGGTTRSWSGVGFLKIKIF